MENQLNTNNKLLRIISSDRKAIAYEKLTVDGTARPPIAIPATATAALMIIESTIATVSIRYMEHGGAPTTTDGMTRSHTEAWEIIGRENLDNFKIIQTGAGTHTLHITYYM